MTTEHNSDSAKLAESRRHAVMKGIKQGAIKGVVDHVVDSMAGPITEAILKAKHFFPSRALPP